MRQELPQLAQLQQQRAKKKKGSIRYHRLERQIATVHERIKNLRREFLHQTTAELVRTSAVLATEELKIQNMSRSATGTVEKSGRMVQQKAGLNREILSLGLSMTHCPAIKIAHRWYSSTRTRLERE